MSQKSNIVLVEKSQISFTEESSRLIINSSIICLIASSFIISSGTYHILMLVIPIVTLFFGIAFQIFNGHKNKECDYRI